jgi:hypothetical protein
MTDFRALCAELVNELAAWQQADDLYSDGGTIRGDADYDLVTRASAALDEPEEGPSDQELYDLWDKEAEYFALYGEAWRFAHAVLARWGRLAVPRASDGPTDDDLRAQIMLWLGCTDLPSDDQELPDPLYVPELLDLLSATLARWGRPAPAPKPIPVSDRLPEDGDCLVTSLELRYCWWANEVYHGVSCTGCRRQHSSCRRR